jgi:3-oxoacyl-[acyl-carrier-protein] synthase-1
MIEFGIVDAAVVGGVDSLCGSVLFGFNSMELLSTSPCRPFDVERNGISLGEAAAFALLERDSVKGPWLMGYGESSDAYHMSSPHPEGVGARLAIDAALWRSGNRHDEVDYVNLHGTASQKNDEVEAAVIRDQFPVSTHASSTKGLVGHTLGAAGAVEAVICLLAIEYSICPGTANATRLDPVCGPQIQRVSAQRRVDVALTESFGFGGNNCALVFAKSRPER